MATVNDLLRKIEDLPEKVEFEWPGVEQWHPQVFDREVKDLPSAIQYIKDLKERVAEQSMVIHSLAEGHNQLIDWIKTVELTSKEPE